MEQFAVTLKAATLLCLAGTLASPATAQRYIFGRADFPLPLTPAVIAAGDFNNDGHPDLAVGIEQSPGNYAVSILLGNNHGAFDSHGEFKVLGQPGGIAVGDFNGDGNLDLAVGNLVEGTVSVLLGKGDGSFKAQHAYRAGKFPSSIAAGDFNGDGKVDLAVATGRNVALLLGNGDGTFRPKVTLRSGATVSVAAGDFNHDGKLDLFVLNGTSEYAVLINKGSNQFAVHKEAAPISDGLKVVAVDLNHDGNLDMVMIGQDQFTSLRVAVLLGDRRGAFHNVATYENSYSTIDLVAADFNRDGNPDIAVALEDGTLNVYYGDGTGKLNGPFVDYWGGVGDFVLAAGDFTGGGNQDLALASSFGNPSVSVLLNKGDGTFINGSGFATGQTPSAIATADLNSDGVPDLTVANFCGSTPGCTGNGSLSVLLGNGDGSYQSALTYPAGGEPTGVVIADFNHDGIRDIAVSNFCGSMPGCTNPGTVGVYLAQAGGTFTAPVFYNAQVGPNGITSGDFNGDGNGDLAVANGCGASANCTQGTVLILLGKGDGKFTAGATLATGKIPKGIVAADFNGDGKLDLAVSNNGGVNPASSVSLFLGRGDGTFKAGKTLATALSPTGLAVADLNGDGNLDLVVAAGLSGFPPMGAVSVLLGDGKGGFAAHVDYPVSLFEALGVAIADFDADGTLDLAVSTSGSISILRGNGDGTFQESANYPQTASSQTNVGGIVAGDWNGDGGIDLATVNGGSPGAAFVLMNPAAAAVSPGALQFPPRKVGVHGKPMSVTLTNASGTPLVIAGISLVGSAPQDYTLSSTCTNVLLPGAACNLAVGFTPTAQGVRGASLSIVSSGLGSPQLVLISGTGL